jgi:DNA-binding response OmpR family regulator
MKILVIDDDHLVRYTLSKILSRKGYEVVTASDGKRGMTLLRNEHPDLVITDIIMPEQEGIDTIIQIRHERPSIKIMAISGGGRIRNIDFLEMARSLGADDIIAKPFEADDLLRRFAELGLPAAGDAILLASSSNETAQSNAPADGAER